MNSTRADGGFHGKVIQWKNERLLIIPLKIVTNNKMNANKDTK